jgi:energy-coupling factor transporter ATP-binding protein EcfA2
LPDNVVVFNNDYSEGVMYQKSVFELFRRFIDQFLIINLLSRKDGFLLHASAAIWGGKGLCFVGPSGAGKSTLLDLFGKEVPRASLLNDDKVALRRIGDVWRVFGTPWYGESRVSSSACADLSALFFIRHAKQNYVRRLPAGEVCRQLMVQALLPVWDEASTSRVLGAFQSLIGDIPAYELGFLPDKSAVELVKNTVA